MASSSRIYSIPSSTVVLTIKAEKLRDRDYFSKSDPICAVFRPESKGSQRYWKEFGRTEMIRNCLSPEWAKTIEMKYFFEERQPLKFAIYDIDSDHSELTEHDFLGSIECDLAEIVSSGTFCKPLRDKGSCGSIIISSEEVDNGVRQNVVFNIRGEKLDKKDFFGKSDPFLNIYRRNDDGSRTLVHRTEFVRKTLNPTWKAFEVNLKTLTGGDRARHFDLECWDNDDDVASSHDFIGGCHTQIDTLDEPQEVSLPLINEKKKAKKGSKYKNSGVLYVRAELRTQHTFLDYIAGGTQLDFAVAVDFTASNGPVHNENSLHYINPMQPNQYEVAIRSVLDICQHYNSRKVFDSYGFGAIVPPLNVMSPVFDLNEPTGVVSNPTVIGTEGVLSAYRSSLSRVQLYGPTNFAPIINEVAKRTAARNEQNGSRYQILLIITDGAISDLQKTKRTIINAAQLPMSIIIIGVGEANFDAMDELDGDGVRLSVDGRFADRDIVQFVPLRNFLRKNSQALGLDYDRVMALLAKEVLAEVPGQLTSYMKKYNIVPRPPEQSFPKMASEYSNATVKEPSAPPESVNNFGEKEILANDLHITEHPVVPSCPHSIVSEHDVSIGFDKINLESKV